MSMKEKLTGVFRGALTLISPRLNTEVCYRVKFGRRLNLEHPQTMNEKILWLKLSPYLNNPVIRQCADKLRVRDYLTERGFGGLLNELLGVYERVEDIDWDALPDRFVLKLNVGCGCNLIVQDKRALDIRAAEKTMRRWMKTRYWLGWSEMQYKGVKPYILAERYLGDANGALPEDYKFYCMNGEPLFVMVCADRGRDGHAAYFYYDRDWNRLPYSAEYYDQPQREMKKPACIDEGFEIARRLSAEFPFVRVDLFATDGHMTFGELTFTPAGGMDKDIYPDVDSMLGGKLSLPV